MHDLIYIPQLANAHSDSRVLFDIRCHFTFETTYRKLATDYYSSHCHFYVCNRVARSPRSRTLFVRHVQRCIVYKRPCFGNPLSASPNRVLNDFGSICGNFCRKTLRLSPPIADAAPVIHPLCRRRVRSFNHSLEFLSLRHAFERNACLPFVVLLHGCPSRCSAHLFVFLWNYRAPDKVLVQLHSCALLLEHRFYMCHSNMPIRAAHLQLTASTRSPI